MGQDDRAVVDGDLRVLESSDFGSPTVDHAAEAPGNTMAPCMVIGERGGSSRPTMSSGC
jgi:hypothetical protein